MSKSLGQILLEKGFINQNQLEYALRQQQSQFGLLGEILVDLGFVSEDKVLASLCEQLSSEQQQLVYVQDGHEMIDGDVEVKEDVIQVVSKELAARHCIMPIALDPTGNELTVAMVDIADFKALDELRFATNKKIKPVGITRQKLAQLWRQHYNLDERDVNRNQLDLSKELKLGSGADSNESSVVKLADNIFAKAMTLGASDIHFDTFEGGVVVRFRIDGALYRVLTLPKNLYTQVTSRIKVLGNMDISEKRLTQEGRISIKTPSGGLLDFRVSVLPTFNGERIAIRIVDKTGFDFSIEKLGINQRDALKFRRELDRPNGLILVTGPTGSGKTTTLYSMINYFNDFSRNIISIEDPVEFGFDGVGQIQVDEKAGLTFASVLRSVLRQDPNVIMVGEIRDEETAQICIRASLTGHLVMATVHTNDAITAIARFKSMGIKPYLVATSFNMAIGQRLVRRLCQQCKVPDKPNPKDLLRLGLKPKIVEKMQAFKGKGCSHCNFTGYKGRLGIFEIVFNTPRMREMIGRDESVGELRKRALKDKMVPLSLDGLFKVQEGHTSVEEVIKNTVYDR